MLADNTAQFGGFQLFLFLICYLFDFALFFLSWGRSICRLGTDPYSTLPLQGSSLAEPADSPKLGYIYIFWSYFESVCCFSALICILISLLYFICCLKSACLSQLSLSRRFKFLPFFRLYDLCSTSFTP